MNKLALVAAAALTAGTFGLAAIAQDNTTTGTFDEVDANNDNVVSLEEAIGAYPTLTEDLFNQADANGDGTLDEAEFTSLEGLTAGAEAGGVTTSSSEPTATTSTTSSVDNTSVGPINSSSETPVVQ